MSRTSRGPSGWDDAGVEGPPPAAGMRLAWPSVPAGLRQAVEHRLGGRVVEAVTQPGGFSPGAAARLKTATGKRAFVKAVGPVPNPESPDIHRAEARIAASLPEGTPAPRLLGFFDRDGWVVLMFEDIEGHLPAQPWVADELALVLRAVAELAVALTPAPIDAPTVADRFGEEFQGWRRLAEAGRRGDDNLAGLDPWARRHLVDLAALETGWDAAAEGASLVHADLRADNLLLTGDRVVEVHIGRLVGRRAGTRHYLVADPGGDIEVEQFRPGAGEHHVERLGRPASPALALPMRSRSAHSA